MRIDVITLFPEMFSVIAELGVTGRACKQNIWQLNTWNPRDYTHDVHHTVDDRPYGGGPGMVMLAEPLVQAVRAMRADQEAAGIQRSPLCLLSPVGRTWAQEQAQRFVSTQQSFSLICGRYEGIDQRFIDTYIDAEISLGDFVLSGGELAAMAVIDSVVRLLPGVLNTHESALQDSFHPAQSGLLDSPHYTRPEVFEGLAVPDVLLSGHHKNIALWRRQQSLRLSALRRPDLIERARQAGQLSQADEKFLKSLSISGSPQS